MHNMLLRADYNQLFIAFFPEQVLLDLGLCDHRLVSNHAN